jgi:hypothetical protein
MILASHGIIASQITQFVGLLDTYSGAAAAYSLRKLRAGYTGSAIEVRRTNNDVADIGFTSTGELDTAALLAFTGTGALNNGFVTNWYDQSGNGYNATQTTAIFQPQIVTSGSVILDNGKPAVKFDGADDRLDSTLIEFITLSSVQSIVSATTNMLVSDQSNYNIWYSDSSLSFDGLISDEARYSINGSALSSYAENHLISNYVNSQINLFANYDTSRSMYSQFNTIGFFNSTLKFDGLIQELVFYPSDQSSNRTGIETNINDFYSIY